MTTLSEVKRLYKAKTDRDQNRKSIDITIDHENFTFKLKDGTEYIPVPTGLKFHKSQTFFRLMMGPVGSAKSTTNITDLIFQAAAMPAWSNGVRRSKFIIIRNTYAELETTTLPEWINWFGNLGDAKKPRMKSPIQYKSNFNDGHGPISIHVIFISLDREEDVKKLDSLNCTSIYLNELRYLKEAILEKAQQRVNRFPTENIQFKYGAKKLIGRVSGDTNPPKVKSWIYNIFEVIKPEGFELFRQPPGLIEVKEGEYIANTNAENLERLGLNYYINSIPGNREREKIKVDLMGEYGISSSTKRIYHEYNDNIHCVPRLEYILHRPVFIGIDYQECPSAVFAQVSPSGRIHLIKELCAEKAGFKSFINNIFKPYISQYLRGYDLIITDDPSGNSKQPTDEKSCRLILYEHGFKASAAYTNAQKTRWQAVRDRLDRNIEGKAAFILSRDGCEMSREGFLSEYHYKEINTIAGKEYLDIPKKNRHADVHDAIQYCIMGIDGETKKPAKIKSIIKPRGGLI